MTRIIQRNDTVENWASNNPILAKGEIGAETETYKIKVGDGSTAWNDLPYLNGSGATTEDFDTIITYINGEEYTVNETLDLINGEVV